MRELPQNTIELPDARVEVVDPGDADGLVLGGQELRELPADEIQIRAERSDVLQRAVVQVEGEAAQPPLTRAHE